jgi:hypothetical protein
MVYTVCVINKLKSITIGEYYLINFIFKIINLVNLIVTQTTTKTITNSCNTPEQILNLIIIKL